MIVDHIVQIFADQGDQEYLGEPVTMAQHMLQSAYFADQAGEGEAVIIAALLHDIGHFTGDQGSFTMADQHDRHHEDAGAAFLEAHFPPIVADCARHHVAAKRYLCATEITYFDRLSEASIHSLRLQGGPMTAAEVAAFDREPNKDAILRVRTYDEAGKDPQLEVPGLTSYRAMLGRVAL